MTRTPMGPNWLKEELARMDLEEGMRGSGVDSLPDDARCDTCRFFHESEPRGPVLREARHRVGTCHIRSTDGPFPGRYVQDWCGEWKEKRDD